MSTCIELAPEVGAKAACAAMAVPRASYYRRRSAKPVPPKSPPAAQKGTGPLREAGRTGHAPLPQVHGQGAHRGVCHPAGRGQVHVLHQDDVPHTQREQGVPREAQPGGAPHLQCPRVSRHWAQPGVVVGHNEAEGAWEMGPLPPIQWSWTSTVATWWAGWWRRGRARPRQETSGRGLDKTWAADLHYLFQQLCLKIIDTFQF